MLERVLFYFFLILVNIAFSSCKKNRDIDTPTNIFEPNFDLDFSDIQSQGFRRPEGEGIDVLILSKHIGDTLIYFQFEAESEEFKDQKPVAMFAQYPINSFELDSISMLLEYKDVVIKSDTSCWKKKERLILFNTKNKLFFEASIDREKGYPCLFILFKYPEIR